MQVDDFHKPSWPVKQIYLADDEDERDDSEAHEALLTLEDNDDWTYRAYAPLPKWALKRIFCHWISIGGSAKEISITLLALLAVKPLLPQSKAYPPAKLYDRLRILPMTPQIYIL